MTNIESKALKPDFSSYLKALFDLMKPRVMSLVIFTCAVGLLIAPIKINFWDAVLSLAAVTLGSGAAGALNMWSDSLVGWLPGWLAGWLWLTAWLLGWLAGVAGMAGRLVADFCMALH